MAEPPKSSEMKNSSFLQSPNTPSSSNGSLQPVTRSDLNSPTTFVHADASSFKQVVQLLTGASKTIQTTKQASIHKGSDLNPSRAHPIPPNRPKQSFKLYERRNSFKGFKINPVLHVLTSSPGFNVSPIKHEILSPSMLDFPSLALSPVTPLIPDPFTRCASHHSSCLSVAEIDSREEDRAIAEKGFYLHKSPATTPRVSEPPRLLPLFPVTSPRVSDDVV